MKRVAIISSVLVLLLLSCDREAQYGALYLYITTEPGGVKIDSLMVKFRKKTEEGYLIVPRKPDDPAFIFSVPDVLNISEDEYILKVNPGDEFAGDAEIFVAGLSNKKVVAAALKIVNLRERDRFDIQLKYLKEECDRDSDGILNCDIPTCCDETTIASDCNDNDKNINPFMYEDSCTMCGNDKDEDCSGADILCEDADNDNSPNCLDCNDTDKEVYPGAPEMCDHKDNNCDNNTDEESSFTVFYDYDGKKLSLGEPCGTGACEGGTVICVAETKKAECSSAHKKSEEQCGDHVDNDCDGNTDEECDPTDIDGDGVPNDEEVSKCKSKYAQFHSEVYPGALSEPCCPEYLKNAPQDIHFLCDNNCDNNITYCEPDDTDYDGFTPPEDCNDSNSSVFPGAPEKCWDGVDQDCFGGDIQCNLIADVDSDGFVPPLDCDDGNEVVNPWAKEVCDGRDDNCNGIVDEGNPGGEDAECGLDIGECETGISACVHDIGNKVFIDCIGEVEPVEEKCDYKDNDCNGKTDEAFSWEGVVTGEICDGTGECGEGIVECLTENIATCSTNADGSQSEAVAELCDNKDNNCNGLTDENLTDVTMSTCLLKGVCKDVHPKAKCNAGIWSCDYSEVPFYEEGEEMSCDGLDNDCDGDTDEDFVYTDYDNSKVKKGGGCGTGECANGTAVCKSDKSGLECDMTIHQKTEICDYKDNDCNGQTDENQFYEGKKVGADCDGIGECGIGKVECNLEKFIPTCSTNPDGTQPQDVSEACDNKDNDCDGATDEFLTDVHMSDCLKQGVCKSSLDKIKANCVSGKWYCDYGNVLGYEAEVEKSCDGLDNDCDGGSDEDFTLKDYDNKTKKKGDSCGYGACTGGKAICTQDKSALTCNTWVLVSQEVCNHLDDDCDTMTDEGMSYKGIDLGKPCDGVGECGIGIVECNTTKKTAVCSTNPDGSKPENKKEICDLKDNDCNAHTDDNLKIYDSSCSLVGVCLPDLVKAYCVNGEWQCIYTGVPDYQYPKETSCDGKDNDCDGQTDEDFEFTDWDGSKKKKGASCGTGECKNGTVVCNEGGNGLTCSTLGNKSSEKCNNKDDDCNGQTDENTDVLCADTHLCTTDKCVNGSCSNTIDAGWCLISSVCYLSGAEKPDYECLKCDPASSKTNWTKKANSTPCNYDNNGCTVGDICQNGICTKGLDADCSYLTTQCKTGKCISTSNNNYQCVAENKVDNTPCNDNQPCTKNDKCTSGNCAGEFYICNDDIACTDNVCDGKGGCSYPIKSGWCKIGSSCYANDSTNPLNPCEWCKSATNNTAWTKKADNTACNDNNACTENDKCLNGTCNPGATKNCNDGNFCTADSCNPLVGCEYSNTNEGLSCNDNNACTHTDICVSGQCIGTSYTCIDPHACTQNVCLGDGNCSFPVMDNWCLIDNTCHGTGTPKPGEQCKACISTMSKTEWSNRVDGTLCTDNNACTTGDNCQSGVCVTTGTLDCDDSNECTDDFCNSSSGCYWTNNANTCNDNNACTTSDVCSGGECSGTQVICDDGLPCTNDSCNPATGCGYLNTCTQPNPQCGTTGCNCGGTVCNTTLADKCENNQCKCGNNQACGSGKKCINGSCVNE